MLLTHNEPSASSTSPEHAATRSDMFIRVCRALDEAKLNWCIVCGHNNYPEDVKPHDVDVLIEPGEFARAGEVIARTLRTAQIIIRESNAWRYETFEYVKTDGSPAMLSFDLFSDIRYPGGVLMEADEFLKERQRSRDLFWTPPARAEFGYYLLKKLEKSSRLGECEFDNGHGARLSELYRADPEGCRAMARKMLGDADADLVVSAAQANDWEAVRSARKRLFETIQRNARRGKVLSVVGYWVADLRRRIRRILEPTGMWICFIGDRKAPGVDFIGQCVAPLEPQAFRGIHVEAAVTRYFKQVMPHKLRSRLVYECATRDEAVMRWSRWRRQDLVMNVGDLAVGDNGLAVGIEIQREILEYLANRTARRFGIPWEQEQRP